MLLSLYTKYLQVFTAVILLNINSIDSCIKLLNSNWKPMPLSERTQRADVVLTAKISSKTAIPGYGQFYAATFEVINILKGIQVIKTLHQVKSASLVELTKDRITLSAKGFGDSRLCFSDVEIGETYALFLGYREDKQELLAKYDDIFGAANLLYKRTEIEILQALGWDDWSSWSKCNKYCGTGEQSRKRKCLKPNQRGCSGSDEQKRYCNIYECKDSINILPFIIEYQDNAATYPWKPIGETFDNQLEKRSASNAPTHLLLQDEFPQNSVLHISFHGPVKNNQFIFSVYNSDHHMKLGIRLTPFALDFVYDKPIKFTETERYSRSFPHSFQEESWYSVAILLKNTEIHININCEHIYATMLNGYLFENFDIFGNMYIGADRNTGSQQNVNVEISQITLVKDESSFTKQCGAIAMEPEIANMDFKLPAKDFAMGSGSVPSGGQLSGPADDSESGDVDEDWGSGEGTKEGQIITKEEKKEPEKCVCYNGGICKENQSCFCGFGYEGKHCETPICKNKCLNNGFCSAPNKCTCKNGTSGSYCQITECQLACKNGGMCIGPNQCKCREGFEGTQCEQETCLAVCENGGTCTDKTKCRCKSGFKGDRCQHKETCKAYVTKLVTYLKPALIYKYIDVIEPCKENPTKKCKTKKLQKETVNQINYRPEYVCKQQGYKVQQS